MLLESLILGRVGLAIDVNPVADCLTGAKASVPKLELVVSRLRELQLLYNMTYRLF